MKFEREMKVIDIPSLRNDAVIKAIESKAVKLDHGKVWVTIQNIKHSRSTGFKSQNHHFNGHVQQLSKELGWYFEDTKKYAKEIAISLGYPILFRSNGTAVLDPWGRTQGISEADANRDECVLLIEATHLIAAENKITLKEE